MLGKLLRCRYEDCHLPGRDLMPFRIWAVGCFVCRFRFFGVAASFFRRLYFTAMGCEIGKNVILPSMAMSWPHQVSIGAGCRIEPGVCFKFDGPFQRGRAIMIGSDVFIGRGVEFNIRHGIRVGSDSLISTGCVFVDHDHGIAEGVLLRNSVGSGALIEIGRDVWIGANAVVLKGVSIGDGAVVGAGSVVIRSVPLGEVWAGVPAKKIASRPQKNFEPAC